MPVRDDREWGQRLMVQADASPSAHAAPRRVVDGVLSETLRRSVWCLVEDSFPAIRLVAMLAGRVRSIALLTEDNGRPAGRHPRLCSVEQVCAHFGVSLAEVALVCANPDSDLVRFPAGGARVIVVNNRVAAARGRLVVRDIDELAGLFDELTTFRATSTYHEV